MDLIRRLLVDHSRKAQVVVAAAVMAWCVAAALYNLTTASRPRHPIAVLEAQFASLIPYLPASGEVGFLEHYADPGAEDAVKTWYTAQYALAPRIVAARPGAEFLIVADGTAHPSSDPRLEEYFRVVTVEGGHQLYRRLLVR